MVTMNTTPVAANSGEGAGYVVNTGYGTFRASNTGYGQTPEQAKATMRQWSGAYAAAGGKSAREQAEDGSSPLGEKIPKLVGTDMLAGFLIIDRDKFGGVKSVPVAAGGSDEGVFFASGSSGTSGNQWGSWGNDTTTVAAPSPQLVTTLVLAFLQTDLGGAVDLIDLRCNDQIIYSARAPKKSLAGLRIYGGDQTAPDPAIKAALGDRASCFPGLAYVVLEDFDIAPFTGSANDLPPFTAIWSTSATAQETSEEESTLTGGEPTGTQAVSAVDHALNVAYQPVRTSTAAVIITTDIKTQTEIRRVTLPAFSYSYFYSLTALQGSDYVVGICQNGAYQGLILINTRTGATTVLAAQTSGSATYEPYSIISSAMLSSGAATKYAIVTEPFVSGGSTISGNDGMVAVADVTNGTLAWITGPAVAPIRSGTWRQIQTWAWGPGGTAYFGEINQPEIYRCQVTENGIAAVSLVTSASSSYITGLAYDAGSNALVYTRNDSHIVRFDLNSGTQVYDVALTANGEMNSIYVNTQDALRPGYVRISDDHGYSQLIDVSTGAATGLYDGAWPEALSYNQYKGWAVEPGNMVGTSLIVKFGDLTPNTVDAVDIITALATYNGDYSTGDLTFTGFVGNECLGLAIRSDTTIAEVLDGVCATLGVRKIHDGGKLNFVVPARDGTFAIDRTLDNDSLVQRGDTSIRQTQSDLDSAIESGSLRFIDPDAAYVENAVRFSRPNNVFEVLPSNRMEEFSTSLVMTVAQAAKQIERIVIESEFQSRQYDLGLMPKELAVNPASIIKFPYGPNDEITVVAEVVQSDLHGDDFSQDIVALEFAQAIESTFVGSGLITVPVQDVSFNVELVILDTALLRDTDDAGGNLRGYAVLLGSSNGAIGPGRAMKSDTGDTFTTFGFARDIAPLAGFVTAIYRNRDNGFATDYDGSLTATVTSGDAGALTSVNEASGYQNALLCAVGARGRWVLVSFGTVNVTGDSAVLGHPIWGVRGTEVYLSQLAAGDRLIWLRPGEVMPFINDAGLLNDPVYYKGGSTAFTAGMLVTQKVVATGEAEKPYAPVELAYSDAGSTRTVTWEFRERLDPMQALYGEAPGYSEVSLAFEVDIMDGSTVLTTLEVTDNTANYDTGTYPGADGAHVYQMGLGGSLRGQGSFLTF